MCAVSCGIHGPCPIIINIIFCVEFLCKTPEPCHDTTEVHSGQYSD